MRFYRLDRPRATTRWDAMRRHSSWPGIAGAPRPTPRGAGCCGPG